MRPLPASHFDKMMLINHMSRDITQKSLRRAIGVVPQDSILFNSTIAYNIGYVDVVPHKLLFFMVFQVWENWFNT